MAGPIIFFEFLNFFFLFKCSQKSRPHHFLSFSGPSPTSSTRWSRWGWGGGGTVLPSVPVLDGMGTYPIPHSLINKE
ncbi:hypothetical protein HanHA300_Chr00c0203g0728121 [Helianthus annuus]|nr:hypothetical protein HanHA300_Chr00c0203g0728121 [Helianthus annuus]